jgi:hypothetical protein
MWIEFYLPYPAKWFLVSSPRFFGVQLPLYSHTCNQAGGLPPWFQYQTRHPALHKSMYFLCYSLQLPKSFKAIQIRYLGTYNS